MPDEGKAMTYEQCAAAGMTVTDTARVMGRATNSVRSYAKKRGLVFAEAVRGRPEASWSKLAPSAVRATAVALRAKIPMPITMIELLAYDVTLPTLTPTGAYDRASLANFMAQADRNKMSDVDMARILRVSIDRVEYVRGKGRRLVTG